MVELLNYSLTSPMQKRAMFRLLRKLRKDEQGVTAIEYGLAIALSAVAAIIGMSVLGDSLKEIFGIINTELENATPS